VRAQYHFRMSAEGLCAWDVRRLVELSRGLPVTRVPLGEIRELDEPYWRGASDGPMTCRAVVEHARLMQECDLDFPIMLSSDGRVMDGMHRVCRALLDGRDAIEAVRFAVDPKPDHVGVAPENLRYDDD
jgi:hypothetical protein